MKRKYLFLSSAILSTIAVPLISSSCEREEKLVEFAIPFSIKDKRSQTLKTLINRYNRESLLKNENHRSISLIYSSTSRETLYYKLSLQLKIDDPSIPSLIMYYPSAAWLINSYNKAIDFSNEIKNSGIINQYLEINNKISLNHSNKFVLPLGNSTDMLVINKLNLGYFLSELKSFLSNNFPDKKLLDDNNSSILNSVVEHYEQSSPTIKEQIRSFWGINFQDNLEKIKNKNFNYSDNIFKFNDDLFQISNDIADIIEPNLNARILYSRHITNLFYNLSFNNGNGNYDDFILKYNQNNLIDYDSIYDPNTKQHQSLRKTYESLNNLINKKALYIDKNQTDSQRFIPPASYDTIFTLTTNNAYNWIIGDNAIYDANGAERESLLKKEDFLFFQAPTKNNATQTIETFINQGVNIVGIKHDNEKDKVVKDFIEWMYDQNNKIDWRDTATINDEMLSSLTPSEYYAYVNNYIFPSSNFIENYKNINESKINLSNLNYIHMIEKLSSNESVLFEEPVDHLSDAFRNKIKYTMNSVALKNNFDETTFEWFIDILRTTS